MGAIGRFLGAGLGERVIYRGFTCVSGRHAAGDQGVLVATHEWAGRPPPRLHRGMNAVVFDVGETLVDETALWADWADWLASRPT